MQKLSYKGIAVCAVGALILFLKQIYIDYPDNNYDKISGGSSQGVETQSWAETDDFADEKSGISLSDQDVTSAYEGDNDYSALKQYTFKNERLARQHYQKHGAELGYHSQEAYLNGARRTIASADLKGYQLDGDIQYLNSSSCDYVVVSPQGYIRTYFRPSGDCEAYFKRQ